MDLPIIIIGRVHFHSKGAPGVISGVIIIFFFLLKCLLANRIATVGTPQHHISISQDFSVCLCHYENMPMQYIEIFKVIKNENFQWKFFNIFLNFAQNIDCGYTLEPPRRRGSNEYPQSMFWSKNMKNRYTLANPVFLYKSGVQGGILFMDMLS